MPGAAAWGELGTALSFELSVLFLARPVLVPEIKEVVSHKYKTPMVSVPSTPTGQSAQGSGQKGGLCEPGERGDRSDLRGEFGPDARDSAEADVGLQPLEDARWCPLPPAGPGHAFPARPVSTREDVSAQWC